MRVVPAMGVCTTTNSGASRLSAVSLLSEDRYVGPNSGHHTAHTGDYGDKQDIAFTRFSTRLGVNRIRGIRQGYLPATAATTDK